MGEVLARAVIETSLIPPSQLLILDHNPPKLQRLQTQLGAQTSHHLTDAAQARMILLAVKPDNVAEVLQPMQPLLTSENSLLISIMAGITMDCLAQFLPENFPIIRVMTNTPCQVRTGMSVLALNPFVTESQHQDTHRIFAAVGECLTLPEKYLDAVTGLSGSGPAFFFLIVDAMIEGGVLQALPRAVARQLVVQTMLGSAELIKQTAQHPGQLRDMVTSPGGTTIAGIQVMEEYKLRATLLKTIETATKRSIELGTINRDKLKRNENHG